MLDPLFSVVIPAYNAEKFIDRALESVVKQTLIDFEIVIINDGSTDNTETKIRGFFHHNNKLRWKLINQQNKGIGGARNAGILAAKAEFIAFLDADDLWLPAKLEKVKQYIDSNNDADLICHDEYWVIEGKNKIKVRYGPYKIYKNLLFKGNSISTSATVVSKSKLLDAGLFSENLDFNGVEDYELWLRLSKICKITYLHEPLGEYHIHGVGITSNIEKHTRNSLNVIEFHFNQWQKHSFYYKYLMNKRRSALFRSASRQSLKVGDLQFAWKMIIQALKLYPFSLKTWIVLALNLSGIRI